MKTDENAPDNDDIIDMRAETRGRRGGMGGMGGGLPIPMGKGMAGLLPILLMLIIGGVCGGQALGGGGGGTGINIDDIFKPKTTQVQEEDPQIANGPEQTSDPDAAMVRFVSFVMDDVNDFWTGVFEQSNLQYERVPLVLFEDGVDTGGCGSASSAAGPFYCPADKRAYIDLGFYRELDQKFGAPGDFAQAYVLAHEVGHHIQNITGTSDKVRQAQARNPGKANDYSVRLELQADCYAGVWANSTYDRGLLESGDIEEGLKAAERVGDDWIQKNLGGGVVNKESWTHGSSAQRQKWFKKGFESGDPDQCDTFSGNP